MGFLSLVARTWGQAGDKVELGGAGRRGAGEAAGDGEGDR